MFDDDKIPEWVAEVFQDWTTLQIVETGMAFAFNRESGKVYKLPHPDCPFVTMATMPLRQLQPNNQGNRRA